MYAGAGFLPEDSVFASPSSSAARATWRQLIPAMAANYAPPPETECRRGGPGGAEPPPPPPPPPPPGPPPD